MSERRRPTRVALCAAITVDGKLDASAPLPAFFLDALTPTAGDRFLADTAPARRNPAAAIRALQDDPHARRILCLGGPRLFRALLDAALVNDLHLLVCPRIDGRRHAPTLSGPPTPEFFPRSLPCRLRRMEAIAGYCLLHYTITRQPPHHPP